MIMVKNFFRIIATTIVFVITIGLSSCGDDDYYWGSRYGLSNCPTIVTKDMEDVYFQMFYYVNGSSPQSYEYAFVVLLRFMPPNYAPGYTKAISDLNFYVDVYQTDVDNWADESQWEKVDVDFDYGDMPDDGVHVVDYTTGGFDWIAKANFPKGHLILVPHLTLNEYPNAVIDESGNVTELGEPRYYDLSGQLAQKGLEFWTVLVKKRYSDSDIDIAI